MTAKDQDTIEIELIIANDQGTDDASGDGGPHQLSLTVNLLPIVRLLARQAAREWQDAANDDRDIDKARLEG